MIKGKHSRRKQSEKMLDRQRQWLKVGRVAEALKATKDQDAWKLILPTFKSTTPD